MNWRTTARLSAALLLAGAAWWVLRAWVLLGPYEALFMAVLTAGAAAKQQAPGASRWPDRILLLLALAGFAVIGWDRLAERNLVLVAVMLAVTGLLAGRE